MVCGVLVRGAAHHYMFPTESTSHLLSQEVNNCNSCLASGPQRGVLVSSCGMGNG